MPGIIYLAINKKNGKVYVGQTVMPLSKRIAGHHTEARGGNSTRYFQRALKKYGFKNFKWEQIDCADNKNELNKKETDWIAFYHSNNETCGYNMTEGGDGVRGFIPSKESREKRGKSIHEHFKKYPRGRFKKSHKEKLSIAHKGKALTKKHRENISISGKGKHTGSKNSSAKLTEEIAFLIKIDIKKGMRNCEIARKYNVSQYIVSAIKTGHTWRHIHVA
jgi:group I intron endonuclease